MKSIRCDGNLRLPRQVQLERVRQVMELLPFASMQNVPLRVYSASMSAGEMQRAMGLQVFWLVTLVVLGKLLMGKALRRVALQGG